MWKVFIMRKKVKTREMDGEPIDVYPQYDLVLSYWIKEQPKLNQITIVKWIIEVLLSIKACKSKRTRERDFSIWIGKKINGGFTIGLPPEISRLITDKFTTFFYNKEMRIEICQYRLRDLDGEPILRYYFGSIIAYKDVVQCITPTTLRGIDEFREYVIENETADSSPYIPIPLLKYHSSRQHTINVWQKNKRKLVQLVYTLKAPCGYPSLCRLLSINFGIEIRESSQVEGNGRINAELNEDFSLQIVITVRNRLHPMLKYIVLTHELSHYVLHYPMLFCQAVIDKITNGPEQGEMWINLLFSNFPRFKQLAEADADIFATYLIVPQFIEALAGHMMEGGRVLNRQDLIWRYFQRLIPDRAFIEYSWINIQEVYSRQEKEINQNLQIEGQNQLYYRILYALCRREDRTLLRNEVETTQGSAFEKLNTILSQA